MSDLHIRWAIARDYPCIYDIERVSFLDDAMAPTAIASLIGMQNVIARVAVVPGLFDPDLVVGWCAYQLEQRSLHLHRLVVAPAYRRQGIGTALVDSVVKQLRCKRTEASIFLEEESLAAQLFFKACGWHCRRHYSCGALEFAFVRRDEGAEIIERIWAGDARVLPCVHAR